MLTPEEQFQIYRKAISMQVAALQRQARVRSGEIEPKRAKQLAEKERQEFKDMLKEVG